MHGLAVDVKEGLPLGWSWSLKHFANSDLCFWVALLHSVSYFFFLYQLPSSLSTVFDTISSNIYRWVLLINPSANVFVWDFSIHHKDRLNYSSGTDRPGELCYNFPISIDLTQMVNFLTRIPDSNSHGPALLDIFLFSDAIICSVIAFLLLGNSHHIVVLVSIDFSSNSQQDAQFHLIAYDYFVLIGTVSVIIWEMFHGIISLNLVLVLLLVTCVECVQVGTDVYIPHHKY